MFRYAHTNLIAGNPDRLIEFYTKALGCRRIGQTRDIKAPWLDRMTGLHGARIHGEHLLLPGWGETHPTLEIFAYDEMPPAIPAEVNRPGLAHLAFEVNDVEETLADILAWGGSLLGEVVTADYADGRQAVLVYARDPEGNIVELQSWKKTKE